MSQAIDDALRFLETPRENLYLLLNDAAPNMLACGNVLKPMYNNLFHVTCVSHLLHNCALKLRSTFPAVDELIGSIKILVAKNKRRLIAFVHFDFLPQPVVTRWGRWLIAAEYYTNNLLRVRQIVLKMEGERSCWKSRRV